MLLYKNRIKIKQIHISIYFRNFYFSTKEILFWNFPDFSIFYIDEIGKISWNTSNTFQKSLYTFKIINHESYESWIQSKLFQSLMVRSLLKAALDSTITKWELVKQRWVWDLWKCSLLPSSENFNFKITRTGHNSNVVRLYQTNVNEKKSYSGFIGISRKYCGKDVMAALQDGRLR